VTNYNDAAGNASPCSSGQRFLSKSSRGSIGDRAGSKSDTREEGWRRERKEKKKEREEKKDSRHGSAFYLVNLFLFSPPGKSALIYEAFACRRISDSPAASRDEKSDRAAVIYGGDSTYAIQITCIRSRSEHPSRFLPYYGVDLDNLLPTSTMAR